ncbi:UNVERIFIED_CONTAM: hypothetical protein K2H54_060922 [Gekko kuhli]
MNLDCRAGKEHRAQMIHIEPQQFSTEAPRLEHPYNGDLAPQAPQGSQHTRIEEETSSNGAGVAREGPGSMAALQGPISKTEAAREGWDWLQQKEGVRGWNGRDGSIRQQASESGESPGRSWKRHSDGREEEPAQSH